MYLFKCIELAVGVIKVRPLIYYKRNILNMCSEDFWLNSPFFLLQKSLAFSSENILLLSPETLYSLIPTIICLCSLFVGEMLCPCEVHFVHVFLQLQGATRGFWTWHHSTSLAALHSHRLESSCLGFWVPRPHTLCGDQKRILLHGIENVMENEICFTKKGSICTPTRSNRSLKQA